ncbi:hypothetical protein [Streptomyces sp. NPDC006132]|uniref:hypothetical protein n=1 Tax=Streptomyces sp. NPDC006132 TaxID=3156732 RepID=UPI0033DD935E
MVATRTNIQQPTIAVEGLKERTGRAVPFLADEPREHPTDNTEVLAVLVRECERRDITVELNEDGAVDLTLVKADGVRTLVGPYDTAAEALDDVSSIGRCTGCRSKVDDTAALYADGYNHIDGSPIRICQPCQDSRATKAPGLALERVIAALPEVLPQVLKRTVPSASDETADLLVTDIIARLRAIPA